MYPVVHALEAIIDEWNCEPSAATYLDSDGKRGGGGSGQCCPHALLACMCVTVLLCERASEQH